TEGFRFPENLAAATDMAPVAVRSGIQKRPVRRRHHAVIGKRSRLEVLEACERVERGENARPGSREGRRFVLERCQLDGRPGTRFRLSDCVFYRRARALRVLLLR